MQWSSNSGQFSFRWKKNFQENVTLLKKCCSSLQTHLIRSILQAYFGKTKKKQKKVKNAFFSQIWKIYGTLRGSNMHVTQLHEVVFSESYICIYRLYFVITWLCCDCIFVYSRSAFLLTRKTCFFCVFSNFVEDTHFDGLIYSKLSKLHS